MAVYSVYMDDERLAKDGTLADYGASRRRLGKISYLVKDPSRYTPAIFVRLRDEGCVVNVLADFRMKPSTPLPRKCDRLLKRLLSDRP